MSTSDNYKEESERLNFLNQSIVFGIDKSSRNSEYQPIELAIGIEEDLNGLTFLLCFDFRESNLYQIKGVFSSRLADARNSDGVRRINECLAHWTPCLIELCAEILTPFSLRFSACDGGDSSALSMDTPDESRLTPDLYAFHASRRIKASTDQAFTHYASYSDFKQIWLARQPVLFWRGATTGIVSGQGSSARSIEILQQKPRVDACLRFRNFESMDLKISRIAQVDKSIEAIARLWLETNGILSEPIEESAFSTFRYFPDIPGNARAWGTVFKYLNGNLVFKPESPRKLYYDRFINPWIHYIPVKSDFSDLADKVAWADANSSEAALIAWRGHVAIFSYLNEVSSYFKSSARNHLTLSPSVAA